MFEAEPKSAPIPHTIPLTKDTPRPHRRTLRPVSGMVRVAQLSSDEGTLRIEVLGYESAEATTNADRLVVSIEWVCAEQSGRCEGPLFDADELSAWADRIGTISVEGTEFSLMEPGLRVACIARDWNGDLIVAIDLLGDAHLATTVEITYAAWKTFGRALGKLARAFPFRRSDLSEAA